MDKVRGMWIFFGIFLGLIVVGIGVYVLQNRAGESIVATVMDGSSDAARAAAAARMQKTIDDYEAAMKADIYGGKTPEETLSMFIDALRNGDAELAAKYTLLDAEDPGLREGWVAEIEKKKNDGRLNEIADILSRAKYNASSSGGDTAWFDILNENGMADYSVLLKLNAYSGVWKIDQM